MAGTSVEVAQKCINNIRLLSAETVQAAKSGHPGAPMGCAPMAHLLWSEVMDYCPDQPKWPSRDRFVLSNGHACALQYTMLHLTGYAVSIEDLMAFRQVGSITPGHPEVGVTDGVEVSTGPLGQGISNAVGLAIAETNLAARFNKPEFNVVDNFTYVICGDGCLQEGVSSEACSLAGTLGLGKLIVLYDDNGIQIDGSTELAFTEDVAKRYEAYNWHVQIVEDGDTADMAALRAAVKAAQDVTDKPSLIKVKTTIGFGAAKQGTAGVHGAPIGDEDIAKLKKEWGFDPEKKFYVDPEVASLFKGCHAEGAKSFDAWNTLFSKYKEAFPADAAEFERAQAGELPEGWAAKLPTFTEADKPIATRKLSQAVLKELVPAIPELVGGSADLTPSNLTKVDGNSIDFSKDNRVGRYLRFGVREHAMCSIVNGIAAYGGFIPFASTFVVFAGYALGAMRLSALSHFRVLYIYTHDSIGLGEDGPTHQPIETLASLRSIPNFLVLRPADGNEVSGAYKLALENAHGPSFMAFSRQNVPHLAGSSAASVAQGAYVLQEAPDFKVILVGTGTEVSLCVESAAALKAAGTPARVVSMPCWSLFDAQSAEYRESVFPSGCPVVSVEAMTSLGWEKYAHAHIAMKTFGASGKGPDLMKHFGFTVDNVVDKATKLVEFYGGAAPSLARPEI
eukprot:CAMPEP_0182925032 /NCGR_PEP_ID=MMETSP0105_2-20130417/8088_1 /TAXON_ID=81532 ORGANISM="Acanthoeca-like sp., Strain 10tr" /NCGR_SAMPLE_ID=MMETSP0105_2 /ASSEMBLY_ACC=CAM_ASM_000205 /LENGTH=677 /DNA_ID=CAMNT_0025062865 /DNA_START=64 /DNA_END=2097 /DNA_ORIENTATION=+